jgi:short-subunit dehydrogenase
VEQLLAKIGDRPVDALVANAGHGLGHAFLDQAPDEWQHVLNTNVTGTLLLIQPIVRKMVERGEGKVLITGSIAGHMAGSFQAVYNGSKAFVDSFAAALGNEIKDSGVTVTCLKPGATETEFFHRAELDDTKVGQARKDDPADVAKTGWEAMKSGEAAVIYGLKNKMQVAAAGMMTDATTAKLHRAQAEPGSGLDS